MITASSLSRLLNCSGSAVLPRSENSSVWADAGHDEHAELAEQLASGDLPEWISAAVPPGSHSEVALAFDVATRTGRILGENIGRAYTSIRPFEIVGSADTVGVDGDAIVIVDFKTGYADVEPAATNVQLAFYALAACRALGKSRAIVRLVFTKLHRTDEAELSAFDLSGFANRLHALHVRVAELQSSRQRGEVVPTTEGSWCKHCSSKPYCGSKNALLVQLAERGLAAIGDSVMTPERRRAAYEQFVRVDQIVADAKKRLNASVDELGPIDLGDGRFYGRHHRTGNEVLDGAVAVQAIREVVGESAKEFEAVAVERRTSKAAIDRAAKSVGAKRGTSPAVVRRIRELGGSTQKADSYPYGEYRGEPQAAPAIDLDAVDNLLKAVP